MTMSINDSGMQKVSGRKINQIIFMSSVKERKHVGNWEPYAYYMNISAELIIKVFSKMSQFI